MGNIFQPPLVRVSFLELNNKNNWMCYAVRYVIVLSPLPEIFFCRSRSRSKSEEKKKTEGSKSPSRSP